MDYLYYPGCTLKTKAKALEDPALASLKKLGVFLKELDEWYCCGASFSLVDDNKMRLVAPVRTLLSAKNEGGDQLVTTCAFCYNTLKRANYVMRNDPEKRRTVNDFIEDEYEGEVEVLHLLEAIRDSVGFSGLGEKLGVNHTDLKIAPHYGCYLLRPSKELEFDDAYAPTIFESFLEGLGAQVVDFPQKTDCCGAFLVVNDQDDVKESSYKVLDGAGRRGADSMVTSCPLCHYNFSRYQDKMKAEHSDFKELKIIYFTELLGNGSFKEGETQ